MQSEIESEEFYSLKKVNFGQYSVKYIEKWSVRQIDEIPEFEKSDFCTILFSISKQD